VSRRRPLEARTMFLSAGCFGILLALIGAFLLYSSGVDRRILETGRRTTVTVLSKHRDSKKQSPVVEIRLDEVPGEKPFYRTLLGDDWERAQPGGTLPYVYDPSDPRGGVLGSPQGKNAVPYLFAAGSVFVIPFLAIGVFLKIRGRKT
jgi:hypothetical protein